MTTKKTCPGCLQPVSCGQLVEHLAGSAALCPVAEVDYLNRLINCHSG